MASSMSALLASIDDERAPIEASGSGSFRLNLRQ
jgi:hypothetical protein